MLIPNEFLGTYKDWFAREVWIRRKNFLKICRSSVAIKFAYLYDRD